MPVESEPSSGFIRRPLPGGARPDGVTAVLTSCGRPDLLERTLNSFFAVNTEPLDAFILVEDGAAPLDVARDFHFPCPATIIATGERVGQTAAIDYAYSRVASEYVFHLEDDWEFFAPGFVEKSRTILAARPDCLQVYVRALDDTNGHPVEPGEQTTQGVLWRRMAFGFEAYGGEWNGFSWNPGLRRLADYVAVGGYGVHQLRAPPGHAGAERVLSKVYRRLGMFAAILSDREGQGYVRHIGWDRTVEDATA